MNSKDGRDIDAAMEAEHPSKAHVRESWLAEVQFRAGTEDVTKRVLYVTLCGKHALDIQMLIDAGIIVRTEAGVIDLDKSARVTAFEVSSVAATAVKRKFPGLDVLDLDIHHQLRLSKPLDFPGGDRREKFQAAVINLDYDKSIQIEESQIVPVRAVGKIGQIQSDRKKDWSLAVTANATINWPDEDQALERAFLVDHLEKSASAKEWLQHACGDNDPATCQLKGLQQDAAQAILAALMTCRLAEALAPTGYRLTVSKAFTYGNQPGRAPMVSWIFRASFDPQAHRQAHKVVTAALDSLVEVIEPIAHLDD